MSRPLTNIRLYSPGQDITAQAAAAIGANLFVKPSGDRTAAGNLSVVVAAAGDRPLGVAAHSAAAGQLVHIARGGVLRVLAAGTITAGAAIQVGAAGTATSATDGAVIGIAVTGAADGTLAEIAVTA